MEMVKVLFRGNKLELPIVRREGKFNDPVVLLNGDEIKPKPVYRIGVLVYERCSGMTCNNCSREHLGCRAEMNLPITYMI